MISMNILQVNKASDKSRMIEETKFTYSPLQKVFWKQTKTIKDQERKQVKALKVLKPDVPQLTIKDVIPKNELNEEAKYEIERIKQIEKW